VTVGSLFSGIEGIGLGLERAGHRVVWHCESNPRLRDVLRHWWPHVPCFHDVRDITAESLLGNLPVIVAGGFPCQATSQAAARSARAEEWLWPEMARVVGIVRPRLVLVENPEALRYAGRGLGEILHDLSELGYDAEWRVVRAAEVGAPHRRARLWLVAHADRDWQPVLAVDDEAPLVQEPTSAFSEWAAVPDLSVADGVPERLAISAYGNAVVPQVAEWIGRRLMAVAA
jgi:DNA (cytosine-5)-methyltransferase 1